MAEIDILRTTAIDEVDYLEKSWEAYNNDPTIIYDKVAGAGRDNVTKYAKEMDDLAVYNGPKQGYAWCKVFVDWCFVQSFGTDRAAELLLDWTASCTQAYNTFKAAGRTINNPKPGDLVFFGNCEHIGIVMDTDDKKIYTVEGNTSGTTGLVANGGKVAQKEYYKTSGYIYGYARPDYNEDPGPTPPEPSGDDTIREIQEWVNTYGANIAVDGFFGPQTQWGLTSVYQIEINYKYKGNLDVDGIFGENTKEETPILRKGSRGDIVKAIQSMAYCRGYDCNGIDGIYGDGTEYAIKVFQGNNDLNVDGVYGPETGYKLFN